MLPLLELTSSLDNPDPWSPMAQPSELQSPAVHSGHSHTPAVDLAMNNDSAAMSLVEWDEFGSQPFVHGGESEGGD